MHIRRLTLTTLFALALCACDRQDLSSASGSINEPDYPAEDALSVRTQSRTYIFPHSYTGSAKALAARIEDKAEALDASVKTAVLHDKASSALSTADADAIAGLLARGGSLVYCEPTRTGTDALLRKLQASYFKFKQIQLGYSIPAKFLKKVKMQNLRVYASMDDWFTISSYPGMDPETATTSTASSMGYDYGSYPTTKKLIFGVNITF